MPATPTTQPATTGNAQGRIPFAANDAVGTNLQGLSQTTTPQGGTAYADSSGKYGQAGALYLKGNGAFYLAPNSLPGGSAAPVPAGQQGAGNIPATNTGMTPVQPTGTSVRTAVNPSPTSPPTDPNGNPIPQYTPAQIAALKQSVEQTANSEGSALSSVPTTSSSSSSSTATASGGASGTTPPASTDDFDLSSAIASLGPAPTAPDLNADTQTQNGTPGGVNDLQSQLNDLNTQLASAQDQAATEADTAQQAGSIKGVVSTIINGQIKSISAQSAAAIKTLQTQITQTKTLLTQAQTAVKTFITNENTDYTHALTAYEDAYSKTITVYQDEMTDQNRVETTAKANAQVIINSYKGSSVGINSITSDMQAQWASLEQQAGLPPGTIYAAVKNELTITKFTKGSDGNMYVSGIDGSGNPYTAEVGYAGGTAAGANKANGTTATPAKSDISSMSSELSTVKGTDGYISPSDWQTALTAWTNAGYSATSFISNFKNFANPNDVYSGLAGNKKASGASSNASGTASGIPGVSS